MIIYHVTTAAAWEEQAGAESFQAPSLETEGFIHCSRKEQVPGVLERYFAGQKELLLLHIDTEKLTAPLKSEPATGGELFPHVYGSIAKEAICEVKQI